MKKIFTFFVMLCAAMAVSASNINLHLTGCTSDPANPTEYTDEDEAGITLNFIADPGYTLSGWEVLVKHGETVIPNNDWASEIGYVYPDPDYGVFFIWFDDITEDFEVTIICQEAGEGPELPEVFTAATFEELEMEANSVYRPESFVVGDNLWFSGAALFNTNVQDWGTYGIGYTSTQACNYVEGAVVSDFSDSYLPSAKGAAEGNNYATINIMGAFEQILFTKTTLSGMAVTNTAFNVNAILNGDGMSVETEGTGLPFHEGDYFLLTIKGLDGTSVAGEVEFYLADFRDAENMVYAENWQWVDLSSLGEIDGLQFELTSTKRNNWGMTTATYFCIDNLGGQASECTLGAMSVVTPEPTAIHNNEAEISVKKMIRNGRVVIIREGKMFDLTGRAL